MKAWTQEEERRPEPRLLPLRLPNVDQDTQYITGTPLPRWATTAAI